jgi:hypothetical protein
VREENTCRDSVENWMKTSWLERGVRRTELNTVVLDGYIAKKREKEYLRVEKSSLNSADEGKTGKELVAVMLRECHDEKIEEREEYLRELVVLLVLAWREKMKTEGVKLFLLDRLNKKLTKELNRKLFNTKLLNNSNFSDTKGFFDIKPLNSFSFSKLLNSGNNTE